MKIYNSNLTFRNNFKIVILPMTCLNNLTPISLFYTTTTTPYFSDSFINNNILELPSIKNNIEFKHQLKIYFNNLDRHNKSILLFFTYNNNIQLKTIGDGIMKNQIFYDCYIYNPNTQINIEIIYKYLDESFMNLLNYYNKKNEFAISEYDEQWIDIYEISFVKSIPMEEKYDSVLINENVFVDEETNEFDSIEELESDGIEPKFTLIKPHNKNMSDINVKRLNPLQVLISSGIKKRSFHTSRVINDDSTKKSLFKKGEAFA